MFDDPPKLRPTTADEIADTLTYALRFKGRKRVHQGDEFMARITAERLMEHLERSGFVVMKKPPMALSLLLAYAAYEAMLLAATLLLPSGPGAFAPSVEVRVFAINTAALVLLLLAGRVAGRPRHRLLHRGAVSTALRAPRPVAFWATALRPATQTVGATAAASS